MRCATQKLYLPQTEMSATELEWADKPRIVRIIKEGRDLIIELGDCINFTNLIKNRAGKIIHRRTIRAEIVRFEGNKDIKIFVRKLGGKNENIENTGKEIEIDPESYDSITHEGCGIPRMGGAKRSMTRRRRTKRHH